MLTTRGWALVVTIALFLAAAVLFGVQELYPLAAAAAALIVFGAVWVRFHRFTLATSRRLRPAQIGAGDSALVEVSLANRARRRSPLLSIYEPFDQATPGDRPPRGAAFRLAPLPTGAQSSASYRLPPTPRGRYVIGPLQLTLTDPFGLVRRSRLGAPASSLTVHPNIVPVHPAPQAQGLDRFGLAGRGANGAGGEEFSSLRPYREGDDLRRVHWASTARLDRVMVRQTDAIAHPRATVAVDLRAGYWTPALFEEALTAAGGVLDAARRTGIEIRMVTTAVGGRGVLDTGFGSSAAHWARVLDALAVAEPGHPADDRLPLAALLRDAGRVAAGSAEDTLTVFTSADADDAELRGLGRLAPPPSLIVVVFGEADLHHAAANPVPGRCVRVAEPGSFPVAWAEMTAPRGRLAVR
jgi:uncharacterized protein (DUF58 family)